MSILIAATMTAVLTPQLQFSQEAKQALTVTPCSVRDNTVLITRTKCRSVLVCARTEEGFVVTGFWGVGPQEVGRYLEGEFLLEDMLSYPGSEWSFPRQLSVEEAAEAINRFAATGEIQ